MRPRTPYTPTGRRYDQRKAGLELAPLIASVLVVLVVVTVVGVLLHKAVDTAKHALDEQLTPAQQVVHSTH